MAGIYNIQWANGLSFSVFKAGSQIEVVGSVENDYQDVEVYFDDTNISAKRTPVPASSNDGYTIEVDLESISPGHRAVMVEWLDEASQTATLFGEVFLGDPNGAGGFGGEQDSGQPEEKRR